MTYGIQSWDASGVLTFDSTLAAGGVCLGFFVTPAIFGGTTSYTFPDYKAGRQGYVVSQFGGMGVCDASFTYDENLGYPRFNFANTGFAKLMVLFLK